MSREDDEYYDNIQDIEDLIQREMQELNKMQEVVNQKRTTLSDMGVRLDAPKDLDESGLLDVLNSPPKNSKLGYGLQSPLQRSGLKSPLTKEVSKLANVGVENYTGFGQGMTYKFGRTRTPEITIKPPVSGVDFMGRNKEQIVQISQKNKVEKEAREKSQNKKSPSKKSPALTKYESVSSKVAETQPGKQAQKPKSQIPSKSRPRKEKYNQVSELHVFEEEDQSIDHRGKQEELEVKSSARSISRTKLVTENEAAAPSKLFAKPSVPPLAQKEKPSSYSGMKLVPSQQKPLGNSNRSKPTDNPSPSPTPASRPSKTPQKHPQAPPEQAQPQAPPQPQRHPSKPAHLQQQPAKYTSQSDNPAAAAGTPALPKPQPKKPAFRPDTMDLFSKLEEYTRFKENMDLLNQAEETVAQGAVLDKKAYHTAADNKENRTAGGLHEKYSTKGLANGGAAGATPNHAAANSVATATNGKKGQNPDEFLRTKITNYGKKEEVARPLPNPPTYSSNSYSNRVLKERSPSASNLKSGRNNLEVGLSPKRTPRGAEASYSSRMQGQLPASPRPQPKVSTPQKHTLSKSIDLKRAVEPRFRREKVELAAEPSFQPMLSRKSLIIAEKLGYNGERLWGSRTPTKQQGSASREQQQQHSNEHPRNEHSSSPWMSRLPGENTNAHSQAGAGTFQPKICEKSKMIDQQKHRNQGPRFEVLHQLGAEQHMKLQRRMREKAREEEEEIKAMSFQPKTGHLDSEALYRSGVGIADRNEQWALRKEERIQRLKDSQMRAEAEQCSFKPKLVSCP